MDRMHRPGPTNLTNKPDALLGLAADDRSDDLIWRANQTRPALTPKQGGAAAGLKPRANGDGEDAML